MEKIEETRRYMGRRREVGIKGENKGKMGVPLTLPPLLGSNILVLQGS